VILEAQVKDLKQ